MNRMKFSQEPFDDDDYWSAVRRVFDPENVDKELLARALGDAFFAHNIDLITKKKIAPELVKNARAEAAEQIKDLLTYSGIITSADNDIPGILVLAAEHSRSPVPQEPDYAHQA